jgi:hypothetical protein
MSGMTTAEYSELKFYWMKDAVCYFPEMPNNGGSVSVHEWGEFMQRESSNFLILLGIEGRKKRLEAAHNVLTLIYKGVGGDEHNGRQVFVMKGIREKPFLARTPDFFLWDKWERLMALTN